MTKTKTAGCRARIAKWAGRAGLGLIEVLVVLVLLILLTLFLLPRLTGGKDAVTGERIAAPKQRAQQAVTASNVQQINQAIQMYRMDHENQNPPNLQELKRYGATDEMLLDPVTHAPLPYDPATGTIRAAGNGTGLPRVPGF